MANMEKLGYAFLKIGGPILAATGEAVCETVGGAVLTGLGVAGGVAAAVAPVALPVAAAYGVYKFFKK